MTTGGLEMGKYSGCTIRGRTGEVSFGVDILPNRVKPCLYTSNKRVIKPLAYFRSEEDAVAFSRMIDYVVDTMQELISEVQK